MQTFPFLGTKIPIRNLQHQGLERIWCPYTTYKIDPLLIQKLDSPLPKSWILPFTKNMDPYNMDTSHTQKLDPPLTWFSVSLSFMTSLNLWRSPSRDRLPSSSLVQRFSASSRAIFRAFLFSSMRDSLAFSLAIFSCLTKTNLNYGIWVGLLLYCIFSV